MVNSMTGFGQAQQKIDQTTISIEVRTVNHRFLDFSLKMPREFFAFENEIKQKIRQYFSRGRVELLIDISGEGIRSKHITVNWNVLDQYLNAFDEIKAKRNISADVEFEDLLQLEDLFLEEEESQIDESLQEQILLTLEEVLQNVKAMRQKEGKTLKRDVLKRIQEVKALTLKINDNIDSFQEEYRTKIKERIVEHLEGAVIDESRIVQEVSILVEKADITEEITRLLSHVEQVEDTLELQQPIGRKLDFIAQELLREANTIGSKSSHIETSKIVVALKSEIEKIKEQVQNIE